MRESRRYKPHNKHSVVAYICVNLCLLSSGGVLARKPHILRKQRRSQCHGIIHKTLTANGLSSDMAGAEGANMAQPHLNILNVQCFSLHKIPPYAKRTARRAPKATPGSDKLICFIRCICWRACKLWAMFLWLSNDCVCAWIWASDEFKCFANVAVAPSPPSRHRFANATWYNFR